MTNPDDLLAAILADPANDDLRMVYADLLDDCGEGERAEFIRRGVYGESHQCVTWDGKSRPVSGGSVRKAWPGSIAAYEDGLPRGSFEWFYRRGFVAEVRCTYEDWERHADAITARCPIERVTLATMPAVMEMYRLAAKHGFGGSPGNRIDRWLEIIAAEWPRIVFTLPAEAPV